MIIENPIYAIGEKKAFLFFPLSWQPILYIDLSMSLFIFLQSFHIKTT